MSRLASCGWPLLALVVVAAAVAGAVKVRRGREKRKYAGRLGGLRVVAIALGFLWSQSAEAQVVKLRSASGSATAIVPGSTTVAGCSNRVLFANSTPVLQCDAGFTYDATTIESIDQTNISGPDATTNVEIGSTANDANAGTGGTSIAIGNGATNSGNVAGDIAIGSSATNSGNGPGNICIGNNCTNPGTTTAAIGIGPSVSMGTGSVNVAIGPSAQITGNGSSAIALGGSAQAGERGTALGVAANATGGVAVGAAAVAGVNQFVTGSANTANTVITNAYFGSGVTNAAPTALTTINVTGGTGSNVAGSAAGFAGGISTGSATPGDVRVKTTTELSSGSTAQSLVDRIYVEGGLKTLTDATATTVFTVTLGNDINCGGQFFFSVRAADATNEQNTTGSVNFSAVDTTAGAGGEACSAAVTGTNSTAASAGTLTVTADATTGTDLCNIRLTATGSLTETVGPRARYSIVFNPDSSTCAITPQ